MDVRFLFWNINKRPLLPQLGRLTAAHNVDVLILAECAMASAQVLQAINAAGGPTFAMAKSVADKLQIFTTLPPTAIIDEFNDPIGQLTIRRLRVGLVPEVLLAAIHFTSQMNWTPPE
jgi:hypothetical protein